MTRQLPADYLDGTPEPKNAPELLEDLRTRRRDIPPGFAHHPGIEIALHVCGVELIFYKTGTPTPDKGNTPGEIFYEDGTLFASPYTKPHELLHDLCHAMVAHREGKLGAKNFGGVSMDEEIRTCQIEFWLGYQMGYYSFDELKKHVDDYNFGEEVETYLAEPSEEGVNATAFWTHEAMDAFLKDCEEVARTVPKAVSVWEKATEAALTKGWRLNPPHVLERLKTRQRVPAPKHNRHPLILGAQQRLPIEVCHYRYGQGQRRPGNGSSPGDIFYEDRTIFVGPEQAKLRNGLWHDLCHAIIASEIRTLEHVNFASSLEEENLAIDIELWLGFVTGYYDVRLLVKLFYDYCMDDELQERHRGWIEEDPSTWVTRSSIERALRGCRKRALAFPVAKQLAHSLGVSSAAVIRDRLAGR